MTTASTYRAIVLAGGLAIAALFVPALTQAQAKNPLASLTQPEIEQIQHWGPRITVRKLSNGSSFYQLVGDETLKDSRQKIGTLWTVGLWMAGREPMLSVVLSYTHRHRHGDFILAVNGPNGLPLDITPVDQTLDLGTGLYTNIVQFFLPATTKLEGGLQFQTVSVSGANPVMRIPREAVLALLARAALDIKLSQ